MNTLDPYQLLTALAVFTVIGGLLVFIGAHIRSGRILRRRRPLGRFQRTLGYHGEQLERIDEQLLAHANTLTQLDMFESKRVRDDLSLLALRMASIERTIDPKRKEGEHLLHFYAECPRRLAFDHVMDRPPTPLDAITPPNGYDMCPLCTPWMPRVVPLQDPA